MAEGAWSMDFMADQLVKGHSIRLLTAVDAFTLEGLEIEFGPWRRSGKYAPELAN